MTTLAADVFAGQFSVICHELNIPTASPDVPGIPLSIGGHYWPGVKGFTWPFYWVMHDKGLVNNGQGPQVHGASCMRAIRSHRPMLVERFLLPIRGLLKAMGHEGLVEVELVLDARGDCYATGIDLELYRPALSQVLNEKWEADSFAGSYEFLAQIRLWRLDDPTYADWVAGRGKTPRKAFREAEKAALALGVPMICYRTDGGVRVKEDLAFLDRAGWLR